MKGLTIKNLPKLVIVGIILSLCFAGEATRSQVVSGLPVILDTDANNELDDQHAIAYMLLNREAFDVKGITVNATRNGGGIDEHYAEAKRIVKLCKMEEEVPVLKGAEGSYEEINLFGDKNFDGSEAVNFIIESAEKVKGKKLVVLAIGKLTNLALALKKKPALEEDIRLVWLGSNYPESGEYNLDDDTSAVDYVLDTRVQFEMVTVRYGRSTGTAAVKVTQGEINKKMPNKGPTLKEPITGRHGGRFTNFGDYSVNLFKHIDYYGEPPSRSLFDVAAVAILKNPRWAESTRIPSPELVGNGWEEQPNNNRKIILWENFDRKKIIRDFYSAF